MAWVFPSICLPRHTCWVHNFRILRVGKWESKLMYRIALPCIVFASAVCISACPVSAAVDVLVFHTLIIAVYHNMYFMPCKFYLWNSGWLGHRCSSWAVLWSACANSCIFASIWHSMGMAMGQKSEKSTGMLVISCWPALAYVHNQFCVRTVEICLQVFTLPMLNTWSIL